MRNKTLFDICIKGTLEEAREALANGADVNEIGKGYERMTSLMLAVSTRNEPLVSLLLQQPGIQVNAKDKLGWTALHYATFCKGERGKRVIRLLLNSPGIDTEVTDQNNKTPLMKAVDLKSSGAFLEEYQKKMEEIFRNIFLGKGPKCRYRFRQS